MVSFIFDFLRSETNSSRSNNIMPKKEGPEVVRISNVSNRNTFTQQLDSLDQMGSVGHLYMGELNNHANEDHQEVSFVNGSMQFENEAMYDENLVDCYVIKNHPKGSFYERILRKSSEKYEIAKN